MMEGSQITNNISMIDILLLDIANRIQLSNEDYGKAQERYRDVAECLSSEASEIAKFDPLVYPQGSFRIQSMISSSDAEDEFDVDCILELKIRNDSEPEEVLGLVEKQISAVRNSLKITVVEKKRRCVKLQFGDNMHIDITPSTLLDPNNAPRPSQIFDAHPERPDHVEADPEGFAQWFDQRILPRDIYNERMATVKADVQPVPEQKPLDEKPLRLMALQLIKRWRDRQHVDRERIQKRRLKGEKIPSVLLSKYVAEFTAANEASLYQVMMDLTEHLIIVMSQPLGRVANPSWDADDLTDRWPGSAPVGQLSPNQRLFLDQLHDLRVSLKELEEKVPDDNRPLLNRMFGERATKFGMRQRAGALVARSLNAQDDIGLVATVRQLGSDILDKIQAYHEQKLPWQISGNVPVKITATLHHQKGGKQICPLRSAKSVLPERWIKFNAHVAHGSLADSLSVHWRVTNTGIAAYLDRGLRGKIEKERGTTRWEHTRYPGVHWVQAFVVNSRGKCIGQSERFYVAIEPQLAVV